MVPPDRNEKIYALELEGRELRSTWTRTEGSLRRKGSTAGAWRRQ